MREASSLPRQELPQIRPVLRRFTLPTAILVHRTVAPLPCGNLSLLSLVQLSGPKAQCLALMISISSTQQRVQHLRLPTIRQRVAQGRRTREWGRSSPRLTMAARLSTSMARKSIRVTDCPRQAGLPNRSPEEPARRSLYETASVSLVREEQVREILLAEVRPADFVVGVRVALLWLMAGLLRQLKKAHRQPSLSQKAGTQ